MFGNHECGKCGRQGDLRSEPPFERVPQSDVALAETFVIRSLRLSSAGDSISTHIIEGQERVS